jgi:hypothetical protein
MNEIMKHPVRMPRIIKVDMSTDLAYTFKTMLEENGSPLAKHIAHKMWILFYQFKLWTGQPHRVGFTCLTGHWHSFCKQFLEQKLSEEPSDQDLMKLLQCINAGVDITKKGA